MAGRPRRLGPRVAGAACLTGVAVTHATEVAHKLDHAPYMGVLFVLLIGAAAGLALLLLTGAATRVAWPLAGALALGAMAGYVVSRTTGLPQMADHVGHWLDVAGSLSLACEALLVALAAAETARPRRATRTVWSGPRLAAPALAAAVLVFSAGAAAQDAVQPGAGAAAHAHDHGGGGHAHADFPDLESASAADLTEARELLRRVHRAADERFAGYADERFAGYADARAAGFDRFRGRGWVRPLVFHMRKPAYVDDDRVLDPDHPESLVYWWPEDGRPVLIAMMFRAPPRATERGAPAVLAWHRHRNARTGELGETAMTHVWLATDLRSAFANCLPVRALEQANPRFSYSEPRSAQAEESRPCGD